MTRVGTAMLLLGFGAVAALLAPGCGGASDYRCDSTGCFQCDGYGCTPVTPPTPTPCTLPNDPLCKGSEVCTDAGCLSPCKGDADCAKGNVCRGGYCASPTLPKDPIKTTCTLAKDCGASGFDCVDGVCVAAAPPCSGPSCTCKYSSDCGTGRVCVDGTCGKKCDATTPCAAGFTCGPLGTCVESSTPTCGAATSTPTCKSGEHCFDGRCSAGCAADGDCKGADGARDPSLRCVSGACVPNAATVANCSGAGDCSGTQKCVDGFCRFLCGADGDCLAHDVRIGACSKAEGICRAPSDLTATCTKKDDCGGKDCVDGQCR